LKIRYFLPAIIWVIIIFIVISIPAGNMPKSDLFKIPNFDKMVHAILFFVFTLLLNFGFIKQNGRLKRFNYWVSLFIGIAYGAFTEIFQHLYISGRFGEFWDFVANLTGVIAAILVFHFIKETPMAAKLSLSE
jgi:VanZ family protein